MKDMLKSLLGIVLVIVVILGLVWGIQGNNFFMYKVFAPKYEQTRREVFEQTKSYNQGMIQEISNMRFQYEQASPEHKAALASIILHRVADFDEDKLPPDLKEFIKRLRNDKVGYEKKGY